MAYIQKRGKSYTITVSCGYDIHGRQVRKSKTFTPDSKMTAKQLERALQREAVLFEEECGNSLCEGGNVKFEAFAEQWFEEYAAAHLKTRTISLYRSMKKRVYAGIGHIRLDKVATRTIQRFIHDLCKTMAPKTAQNYFSFISGVFSYAVSQGMISTNPCKGVKLPPVGTRERACYTLEEAQAFLAALQTEPMHWRIYYILAIFGGFRRGELLGLEWKDIDFETGVISIRRTSLYTPEHGVFTDTPKTARSVRSLKMTNDVMDELRRYRIEQNKERLKVGDKWQDSDRLFTTWNGAPLNPSCVENWLSRFFDRTDLRKVNPHSFRHLNASLLISCGTDVRTVSAALGHSQTSTTLNIYAHSFEEAQAKATAAISESLSLKILAK